MQHHRSTLGIELPGDKRGQQQTACTPRHLNKKNILDWRNSPHANTDNFSVRRGTNPRNRAA